MIKLLQEDKTALHRRIVEAAVLAPSAENAQPWQFRSDGDRLTIYLDRRQEFASDVDNMLTLTGLGACIENAVIASRAFGYEPTVKLKAIFPHDTEQRFVPLATIDFNSANVDDPLFSFLGARCTCRRMDGRQTISTEDCARLSTSVERFSAVQINWLTDLERLKDISQLIGQGNRIRFEHEPFHRELYHHLRFSREEVRDSRDGLDVATLQLPPGVALIMWLLRKWKRMRVANLLGFSRGVARQAAQEVRSSGAVGILTIDAAEADDFLAGGRALERLWLTATSSGLALHPVASLAVFIAHVERTDLSQLLPRHAQAAREMTDRFYGLCPELRGRVVQFMFRLGHGARPGTRSLRRTATNVLDFN